MSAPPADEGSVQVTQEQVQEFAVMRQGISDISEKVQSLEMQRHEHSLVLKSIDGIPDDRRCFRLVGGVLVEKNVGVVRPEVQANAEQLKGVMETMAKKLKELELALVAFMQANNLTPKHEAALLNAARQLAEAGFEPATHKVAGSRDKAIEGGSVLA